MTAFLEYFDFSDVIHTMSKEHDALHRGEEENPVTLCPEHSRSLGGSLPENSLTGFRNRDILSVVIRMCRDL